MPSQFKPARIPPARLHPGYAAARLHPGYVTTIELASPFYFPRDERHVFGIAPRQMISLIDN